MTTVLVYCFMCTIKSMYGLCMIRINGSALYNCLSLIRTPYKVILSSRMSPAMPLIFTLKCLLSTPQCHFFTPQCLLFTPQCLFFTPQGTVGLRRWDPLGYSEVWGVGPLPGRRHHGIRCTFSLAFSTDTAI